MLFNTLAYARFFGIVFVTTWLLVDRRMALLLPWLALAATALFAFPGRLSFAVTAAALALTLPWVLRARSGESPPPLAVVGTTLASLGGLLWLTLQLRHQDPLGLALQAMGTLKSPHGLTTLVSYGLLALLWLWLARARQLRLLFLLGASYVFYAHWDWRFLPLIWGSSTIDWLLGHAIGRTTEPHKKRLWLIGTVVVNLGVLGIFKYYDFGIESVSALATALGLHVSLPLLRYALPVGISFFTFESMSYVIDVYRGQLKPHQSYVEYLSFVAFFPHLVAGPIVRPRDLLPQLAGPGRFSSVEASEAILLIAGGLFKKAVIGDTLAINLVDRVFDAPLMYSGLECYLGVVGYALQIYCDFSGYTDIAIGSAALLGVRFPLNFNAPYQATGIADFWHRWHISLSTWLRDYLYVPLGGNRRGSTRTYVNLLLTMLLGGLWHGANWTFVIWGGLHGAALAVSRGYERWRGKRASTSLSWPRRLIATTLTFHFVCLGWVFFRAENFSKASLVLRRIASLSTYHPNLHPLILSMLALGLISHATPKSWDNQVRRQFGRLPVVAQGLCLFLLALTIRRLATAQSVPFVYFQF